MASQISYGARIQNSPPSRIPKELFEKVKRQPLGKGREVLLKRDEVTLLLSSGRYAFISGGRNPANPTDSKLTDSQIEERYQELRSDLIQRGYAFTKVKGHYQGEEDSFLVMAHDADREDIKKLGKQYNQDSIIFSENGSHEMHYTTGKKEGKFVEGKGWNEVHNPQDMFTELPTEEGSLKFALNFDFDQVKDTGKKR